LIERVLQSVVQPLTRDAMNSGAVTHWFFLPYSDPDSHVRLRLFGDPRALQSEILPRMAALTQPLLDNHLLARVQYDTYVRELERYGDGPGIALAERLFHVDSECALGIVAAEANQPRGREERLLSVLASVSTLFDAFDWTLEQRRDYLSRMTDAPAAIRKNWGDWYRRHRQEVEAMFSELQGGRDWRANLLSAKVTKLRQIASTLAECERRGELDRPLNGLMASYTHMCVVRTLARGWTAHEPLCYDALRRFYQSILARSAAVA